MNKQRICEIATLVDKLDSIRRELDTIKSKELNELNDIKNTQIGEQPEADRMESMQISIDQICLAIFCIHETIEHLEDAAGVNFLN